MKRALLLGVFVLSMLVVQTTVTYAEAEIENFAKTSTTFGWEVINDKPPVSTIEMTEGPGKSAKALVLKYQFDDGVWIALTKAIKLSLKSDEGLAFQYKGTGGGAGMWIKLTDSAGAVAGFNVPGGTSSSSWRDIVIPRGEFKYLYGGSTQQMQWNGINKMEITLDSPQAKGTPGELGLYDFKVAGAKALKESSKTSAIAGSLKVHKTKDGAFLMHKFDNTDNLSSRVDQDGSVQIAAKTVILNEKTTKSVKVDYDFGSKGIWNAVVVSCGKVDMGAMKNISFLFKGTGGEHILQFKVKDGNGATFGYEVNYPTNIKKWARIVVPKEQFQYMYGGNGSQNPEWSNIQEIEYVIRKKEGSDPKGSINLYQLEYK